jgi:hypothetical protein
MAQRQSAKSAPPASRWNILGICEDGERQSGSRGPRLKERKMTWVMAPAVRKRLSRTAVAATIAGVAAVGVIVPASAVPVAAGPTGASVPQRPPIATDDPGCEMFGWRHPLCAGGAFESPADDGVPGDNAAEGGIPAPAMLPNINGSMSPPGTPGTI